MSDNGRWQDHVQRTLIGAMDHGAGGTRWTTHLETEQLQALYHAINCCPESNGHDDSLRKLRSEIMGAISCR